MSTANPLSKKSKNASTTSENDSSLCGDQADEPFMAPAFWHVSEKLAGANSSRAGDDDDDGELPSNLMNSRSNVPGMTPAELMAAHRRSIGVIPGNEDREIDLHSLTLSRHQVEPGDMFRADMNEMPDEEFQDCLRSFKFGDAADVSNGAHDSIHASN